MTTSVDNISAYSGYSYNKDFDLEGVGKVPISQEEKTSPWLVEEYKKWLKVVQDIFNKANVTGEDLKNLQEALNQLANLAKTGDTSTTPPSYMQPEMLENLNNVFTLLVSKGIVPNGKMDENIALAAIAFFQTFEWKVEDKGKTITLTFDKILQAAIGISGSEKSLQSMLYTDFILAANAEFNKKLVALKEAIEAAKAIGATLASIQELRNLLIKAGEQIPGWKDGKQDPLSPEIGYGPEEILKLREYAKQLEEQIKKLKELGVKDTEGSLTSSLQKVLDDIGWVLKIPEGEFPNNWELADRLTNGSLPPGISTWPPTTDADKKLVWEWAISRGMPNNAGSQVDPWKNPSYFNDALNWADAANKQWLVDSGIDTTGMTGIDFQRIVSGARNNWANNTDPNNPRAMMYQWLLDSQNKIGGKAGAYQDNISKAVTAATNFNDTQKEELRSTQYGYEQFIKIAAELMQILQKIVSGFAQKMA